MKMPRGLSDGCSQSFIECEHRICTNTKRKTCSCARTRNKEIEAKEVSILTKKIENFRSWEGK